MENRKCNRSGVGYPIPHSRFPIPDSLARIPPPLTLSGFLFALLLCSCSVSPLGPYDRIAFAPLSRHAGSGPVPHRVRDMLASTLVRTTREGSRFSVASDAKDLTPRTAVVHPKINLFESAKEGETAAAQVVYLFTDLAGNPVMGASIFSLARRDPGRGRWDALGSAVGKDFLRFLHRMGGKPVGLPPEAGRRPSGESPVLPYRPPRASWPPRSFPGRLLLRARFGLISVLAAPAGRGRGAPDYDDLFEPGTSAVLEVGFAAAPGLEISLGAGRGLFRGKTHRASGLVLDFDSLTLDRIYGGTRITLPLFGPRLHRWWSFWDPLEDTRGILLCASIHAGTAVHRNLSATVVEDTSGEAPALSAGDRILYYRKGAVFFGEILLGLTVRLGEGRRCSFSGSLLSGVYFASAPAPYGVGATSGTMWGIPFLMELSIRF